MATVSRLSSIFRRGISSSQSLKASPHVGAHHANSEKAMELWMKVTYFVAIPSIVICAINTYIQHNAHHHERPEFIPYEHMRLRGKKFPWGDGQHTLFHNPEVNPLPTGYET